MKPRRPAGICFGARLVLAMTALLAPSTPLVHEFTSQQQTYHRPVRTHYSSLEASPSSRQRRSILSTSAGFASLFLLQHPAAAGAAVVVSSDQKVFKPGESMGTTEALTRFQQAQKDLEYLITHYDEIVANGGGDNVRRYLGTVGFSSSLYGISKVLKELQDEADDIVEYTENMNEFDAYLRAADTACYSANFVEFSAAKTKPEAFFKDAFGDVLNMKECMNNIAVELKLNKI